MYDTVFIFSSQCKNCNCLFLQQKSEHMQRQQHAGRVTTADAQFRNGGRSGLYNQSTPIQTESGWQNNVQDMKQSESAHRKNIICLEVVGRCVISKMWGQNLQLSAERTKLSHTPETDCKENMTDCETISREQCCSAPQLIFVKLLTGNRGLKQQTIPVPFSVFMTLHQLKCYIATYANGGVTLNADETSPGGAAGPKYYYECFLNGNASCAMTFDDLSQQNDLQPMAEWFHPRYQRLTSSSCCPASHFEEEALVDRFHPQHWLLPSSQQSCLNSGAETVMNRSATSPMHAMHADGALTNAARQWKGIGQLIDALFDQHQAAMHMADECDTEVPVDADIRTRSYVLQQRQRSRVSRNGGGKAVLSKKENETPTAPTQQRKSVNTKDKVLSRAAPSKPTGDVPVDGSGRGTEGWGGTTGLKDLDALAEKVYHQLVYQHQIQQNNNFGNPGIPAHNKSDGSILLEFSHLHKLMLIQKGLHGGGYCLRQDATDAAQNKKHFIQTMVTAMMTLPPVNRVPPSLIIPLRVLGIRAGQTVYLSLRTPFPTDWAARNNFVL